MSQAQSQSNILFTGVEDKETAQIVDFEFIFRVLFSDMTQQAVAQHLDELEEKLSRKYFSDLGKLQQNFSKFDLQKEVLQIDADSFITEVLVQLNSETSNLSQRNKGSLDIQQKAKEFRNKITNFNIQEHCEALKEEQKVDQVLINLLCDKAIVSMEQEAFSLVIILDQYIRQFENGYQDQQIQIQAQIIKIKALPKLNRAQKKLLLGENNLADSINVDTLASILQKFKVGQLKQLVDVKDLIQQEIENTLQAFMSFFVNWKQVIRLVQVKDLTDTDDIKRKLNEEVQKLYEQFLNIYSHFQDQIQQIQGKYVEDNASEFEIATQAQEKLSQFLRTFIPSGIVHPLSIKEQLKQSSLSNFKQSSDIIQQENSNNQKSISLIELKIEKSKSSKQEEGISKSDLKVILLQNRAKMIKEGKFDLELL